jgi:hypothetical protein
VPNLTAFPPGSFDTPAPNKIDSVRTLYEKKTSPAACMQCHSKINPIGFALEKYDALGRVRADGLEIRYFNDNTGVYDIETNTSVDLEIDKGNSKRINGPDGLFETIGQSRKASMCLTVKWFRYAFRRKEKKQDGCHLQSLHNALVGPAGSIKNMIRETTLLPIFKNYRFSDK